MSAKVTPWFSVASQAPKRFGVYQVECGDSDVWYAHFGRHGWGFMHSNPRMAEINRRMPESIEGFISANPGLCRWRGLAERPKP